jgi:hypothetical protein
LEHISIAFFGSLEHSVALAHGPVNGADVETNVFAAV